MVEMGASKPRPTDSASGSNYSRIPYIPTGEVGRNRTFDIAFGMPRLETLATS